MGCPRGKQREKNRAEEVPRRPHAQQACGVTVGDNRETFAQFVGKKCSERGGCRTHVCVLDSTGDVSELGERDSGERAARTERRQSPQVLARPGEGLLLLTCACCPRLCSLPSLVLNVPPRRVLLHCVWCVCSSPRTRARGCCSKTERRQVGSARVCRPGPLAARVLWVRRVGSLGLFVCHLPGPLWGGTLG